MNEMNEKFGQTVLERFRIHQEQHKKDNKDYCDFCAEIEDIIYSEKDYYQREMNLPIKPMFRYV